jgi:murein DD-endopeptidase MepM/ murein hydrolase activator NlpD
VNGHPFDWAERAAEHSPTEALVDVVRVDAIRRGPAELVERATDSSSRLVRFAARLALAADATSIPVGRRLRRGAARLPAVAGTDAAAPSVLRRGLLGYSAALTAIGASVALGVMPRAASLTVAGGHAPRQPTTTVPPAPGGDLPPAPTPPTTAPPTVPPTTQPPVLPPRTTVPRPLPAVATSGTAGLPLPLQYLKNGSVDQGVDYSAPGGTPLYAMGSGTNIQEGIGGFGPNAPVLRITSGPLAGRTVYYGHSGPDLVHVGDQVTSGQQISIVGYGIVGISSGPHLEIGFWPLGQMGAGRSMLTYINSVVGHSTGG